jgi:hypothetical protein
VVPPDAQATAPPALVTTLVCAVASQAAPMFPASWRLTASFRREYRLAVIVMSAWPSRFCAQLVQAVPLRPQLVNRGAEVALVPESVALFCGYTAIILVGAAFTLMRRDA